MGSKSLLIQHIEGRELQEGVKNPIPGRLELQKKTRCKTLYICFTKSGTHVSLSWAGLQHSGTLLMRAPTNLMAVHYLPVCCQLSLHQRDVKKIEIGVDKLGPEYDTFVGWGLWVKIKTVWRAILVMKSSHDPQNILSSFIISPNKVNLSRAKTNNRTFWATYWVFM